MALIKIEQYLLHSKCILIQLFQIRKKVDMNPIKFAL